MYVKTYMHISYHVCRQIYMSLLHMYLCACIYIHICHRHGKGIGKETMRFGAFVIFGGSNVDTSRFADKSWWFQYTHAVVFLPEDWSRWSWHHYVMSQGSLMLLKGGNYKRRAWPNLRAVDTVIWVFWYKVFGFVRKPQTLYLSCLGALQGGSITRMNIATYSSIRMHPDLSGGLSVIATLVVWWQLGRSLPSPLEPGIEQSMDHNPLVANCKGRINH